MAKPFKFQQFEIIQEANPLKVGTDSMLLGAWTAKSYSQQPSRILDIGTGTGILALMMAQSFDSTSITAIEPVAECIQEAQMNFSNSIFSNRIMAIETPLQSFGALEKFDLIICNPPYYDGSYRSEDEARNIARHTTDLSVYELYEHAAELLAEHGRMNLVIPTDELSNHLERAFDHDLFLQEILHTVKENGERKRALISLGLAEIDPTEEILLVKDSKNEYSPEYIALTKPFYGKNL